MGLKSFAVVSALSMFAATGSQAATANFNTALKGSNEVPPNTTTGTGEVKAVLDTSQRVLTYTITYSGLTSPVVAAHFHGPAAPGVNAPPIITITDLKSPITGTAKLTAHQEEELQAGKWYFNIHTAQNKGGEIRGQLPKE
ncbi:CHRD domain-containing protein [Phenylobacterium montanum]|uniref:CHRD domain-containing protein n=1 Tax=Phenylobacterium montanum TaxID=2823693 RepID=A0A975G2Y4_9CAUL|nr:CHRD domain-containing protein [Caulobacter sp. S6]QUD89532.1 CHRD domain-containing protein [Caulobacter sp. S6]